MAWVAPIGKIRPLSGFSKFSMDFSQILIHCCANSNPLLQDLLAEGGDLQHTLLERGNRTICKVWDLQYIPMATTPTAKPPQQSSLDSITKLVCMNVISKWSLVPLRLYTASYKFLHYCRLKWSLVPLRFHTASYIILPCHRLLWSAVQKAVVIPRCIIPKP